MANLRRTDERGAPMAASRGAGRTRSPQDRTTYFPSCGDEIVTSAEDSGFGEEGVRWPADPGVERGVERLRSGQVAQLPIGHGHPLALAHVDAQNRIDDFREGEALLRDFATHQLDGQIDGSLGSNIPVCMKLVDITTDSHTSFPYRNIG